MFVKDANVVGRGLEMIEEYAPSPNRGLALRIYRAVLGNDLTAREVGLKLKLGADSQQVRQVFKSETARLTYIKIGDKYRVATLAEHLQLNCCP